MKRLLSILLVLVIVFGMVPANVFADQTQRRAPVTNVSDPAIIDNKNMTVTGTNHIGEMVSKDIQQEQAADAAALQNGYDVVSLTVENNAANVEFYAKDEASIVVAIYTEDRSQMISSSTVDVVADQTEVTLTLPDTLPQYFHASAYMVGKKDQRPLCSALHTTMYTKDMQELLSSTIYDYDPNLVVNLDGRTDTNFAVYNEDTVVVQEQAGTNTVVSSDEDNLTYVIENPSQEIRSLMYGDVLSLPYGDEDILFIKVDRVTVSGTRATITGLPIEMQDVFSYVKIDGEAGAANAEVDTSNADEGVTFEGISEERPTRAIEGGSSATHTLTYNFYKDVKAGTEGNYGEVNCQLNGSFSLKFSIGVKYYIALLKQEFNFSVEAVGAFNVGVEGTAKLNIPLGRIAIPVFAGINVGFEPALVFEVNGKAELTISVTSKFGFSFTTGDGIKNISEPIKGGASVEAEITIFVGFDLAPQLSVISPSVAKVTASVPIGVELTAKMTGAAIEGPDALKKNNHTCTYCIDIDLDAKFGISIKMTLLDKSWLSWGFTIIELKWRIMDAYYSIDHNEFDWGQCPYKAYPLTVTVFDSNDKSMEGVTIQCNPENHILTTNSEGKATVYLPNGEYTLSASKGDYAGSCTATVDGDSSTTLKVILTGTVTGNVKWSLTESGDLTIFGNGTIPSYSGTSRPWSAYIDRVKSVTISSGITGIGANVFQNHPNMKSVYIGDSVSSMDLSAFNGLNLSKFTVSSASKFYTIDQKGVLYNKGKTVLYKALFPIVGNYDVPDTVTSVASKAFAGQTEISLIHFTGDAPSIASDAFSGITSEVLYCTRTTGWSQDMLQNYGGTITWRSYEGILGNGSFGNQLTWQLYNDGVLRISGIGDMQDYITTSKPPWYKHRESIKEVVISNGITGIGDYSFYDCAVLDTITIPDNVSRIGQYAFYNCSSLIDISLPKTVSTIGPHAFQYCSSLTKISIPEAVTRLENYTFYGCSSLNNLNIPSDTTYIGQYLFYGCKTLTTVYIPNGVQEIGSYAFSGCESLAEVHIENGVKTIGYSAFSSCSSLLSVSIPSSVTLIDGRAFYNCDKLISVRMKNAADPSQSKCFIRTYAFSECKSLREIRFSNTVYAIYDYAFGNCSSLITVIIPEGLNRISSCTFSGCSSLVDIVIPNSVTFIGKSAFSGCRSLQSITIPFVGEQKKAPSDPNQYPFGYIFGTYNYTGSTPVSQIDYNPSDIYSVTTTYYIPSSLKSVTVTDGDVLRYAFKNCSMLQSITLTGNITLINGYAFSGCSNLTDIKLSDSITSIDSAAFAGCISLTSITIPRNVEEIYSSVFSNCPNLKSITFEGNAPTFNNNTFKDVTLTAYYPAGNATWTEDVRQAYGGTITWVAYTPTKSIAHSAAPVQEEELTVTEPEATIPIETVTEPTEETVAETAAEPESIEEAVKMTKGPKAIFQPAYTSAAMNPAKDVRSSQRPKARTVTFDGLDAGAEYIFLSLINEYEENPLIPDNLLYIDQLVANSSGTITVTYIPRINSDTVYEMVTGGAKSDIADATVTWPSLSDNGDIQFFSPTVTYNGTTLTEGVDYVMRGDISFSAGGNYTCYIEGIGNYIGSYLCVYTVAKLCSHSNYTILPAVSATCTESGKTQGKQCNQCGEIFEEQWEVPAYGHTLVTLKAVAATCTSSGKTAGSYCSKCGVTIVAQQKIPALGHKGDTFVVAPTCTASGYTVCICYTCGDTIFSDTVAATGHKYISKVTAPDCENSGYTTYTCSACGNSYVSDETEALGHSFTNGICKTCGIGDISHAQVTWSFLQESDDPLYFAPTVKFNDTLLTEGIDYRLDGDITFSASGEYTCYIVGIGNYIGRYTCQYYVEEAAYYSKGLSYTLNSNGTYYSVSGIGTCTDTDIVIPAEYNGLPVKVIGSNAFKYCSNITTITIPDSVTSIGNYAFDECQSLTSITIPNSVTSIGNYAFRYCSSLTSITIPNSVTSIGNYAFDECQSLTIITIPNSVTSIGNSAFSFCRSLTSINIPNSVTSIGDSAFYFCTSLASITIPEGVTSIGNFAFSNCSNLTSITIPNSVTSIGGNAFSNCISLTSITIPNSVTSIGGSVFSNCSSLTSITIPNSVTSIGGNAFSNCIRLISITIPEGVTSIGDYAFYNCRTLTSITIPEGVTSIGYYAFYNCSGLTSITIPNSVTSISTATFYNCSSLTSITIPNSVTSIGSNAFYSCSSLTSISIPNSVTSIENYTFYNCSKLTSIQFLGNAPTFGSNAFSSVRATAYYPAGNTTWTDAVKQNYGGTITWVPFTETAVKQWNLTVSDNIGVNFYITVNAADVDSTVVEITVDDVTVCCPVSNATQTGNANEYRFSAEISAAQMTQPITVCVITDGLTVVQKTYTVREYAQYILDAGNDFDAGIKALVREMLNYGAMAQVYFGYDTDNLPNEGITNVAATDVPKNMEEATLRDNIDSLNFYGASLVYQDRIAVRYYFTGDVTGLTFTANGNTYSPAAKDEMYYIEIADIAPQDLDLQITLTATDADGNMLTVAYSPMNYIVRMTQKGDENTRNLMRALYNYHLVAKSLFGKETVARWNLTLEDDLKVKFYLNLDENESVKITVGNISNTYAATDLEKSDDAKHIVSVNISAAQMMDDITVQLVGRYDMKSYSIRQYFDAILAEESFSKYHALVKKILTYGAMAQLYFDYNTENLANYGIADVAAENIPDTMEEMTVSGEINELNFYGASLVYRDRIAVRFYFTGDVTGCTFIANGKIYTPVEKDGMHYVEIADILPQNLDQQITLTVSDASGNTLSVTYGPMNYIVRMNEKGSDTLKALVKALYNYHLAAKALSTTA